MIRKKNHMVKQGSILFNALIVFLFLISLLYLMFDKIGKELSLVNSSNANANLYYYAESGVYKALDILNAALLEAENEIASSFFNAIEQKNIMLSTEYITDTDIYGGSFYYIDTQKEILDILQKNIMNETINRLKKTAYKVGTDSHYFSFNAGNSQNDMNQAVVTVEFNRNPITNCFIYRSTATNNRTKVQLDGIITLSGNISYHSIDECYMFDSINILNNTLFVNPVLESEKYSGVQSIEPFDCYTDLLPEHEFDDLNPLIVANSDLFIDASKYYNNSEPMNLIVINKDPNSITEIYSSNSGQNEMKIFLYTEGKIYVTNDILYSGTIICKDEFIIGEYVQNIQGLSMPEILSQTQFIDMPLKRKLLDALSITNFKSIKNLNKVPTQQIVNGSRFAVDSVQVKTLNLHYDSFFKISEMYFDNDRPTN